MVTISSLVSIKTCNMPKQRNVQQNDALENTNNNVEEGNVHVKRKKLMHLWKVKNLSPSSQKMGLTTLQEYGERFMSMFDDYDGNADVDAVSVYDDQFVQGNTRYYSNKSNPSCPRIEDSLSSPVLTNEKQLVLRQHSTIVVDQETERRRMSKFLSKGGNASCSHVMPTDRFLSRNMVKEFEARSKPVVTNPISRKDEFKQVRDAIERLGASQLKGKAKKEWEARKIVEIGCALPAAPKVPYTILQGMTKKAKERMVKQREDAVASGEMSLLKAAGMKKKKSRFSDDGAPTVVPEIMRCTSTMNVKKKNKEMRATKARPRGMSDKSVGTFSGGVLYLNPEQLKKIKSK